MLVASVIAFISSYLYNCVRLTWLYVWHTNCEKKTLEGSGLWSHFIDCRNKDIYKSISG